MLEKIKEKVKEIFDGELKKYQDTERNFKGLVDDLENRKNKYLTETATKSAFTADYHRLSDQDLKDVAKMIYDEERETKLANAEKVYQSALKSADKKQESAKEQFENTERSAKEKLDKEILQTGEKSAKNNVLRSSARELKDRQSLDNATEKIQGEFEKLKQTVSDVQALKADSKATYDKKVSDTEKYYDDKVQSKYDEIADYKKKDNDYTRSFIDGKKTNDYINEQANALIKFVQPLSKTDRERFLNSDVLTKYFNDMEIEYFKKMFL